MLEENNEITKDVQNEMIAHGSSRNKGGQGHVTEMFINKHQGIKISKYKNIRVCNIPRIHAYQDKGIEKGKG